MKQMRRHAGNSVALISALYMGMYCPLLFDVVNLLTFLIFSTADIKVKRRIRFQEGLTLWSVFGTAATSILWTSQIWLVWVRVLATMGHTIMQCDNKYKKN